MLIDDAVPESVLVVTAHPDDVDFGAAGTVARWTGGGAKVTYCIVTDGDAGGFDPAIPRDRVGPLRRREQTAAAAAVGVHELVFLGFPDGATTASLELRRAITAVIRSVRPARVLTQSPERNYQRIFASHPDHLAVGEAALCAVYPDARNPFTFPELREVEGLEPHTVPEVWLMAGPQPDRVVDVTDTFDRKLAALLCHESQHPDPGGLPPRMRAWGEAQATQAGLPAGRLAESFQLVVTG